MIKKKYLDKIKLEIKPIANNNKLAKFFIFGSSLRQDKFGDIDLAVVGASRQVLGEIKDKFADSSLPYFVDVVDFSKASAKFKENVLSDKILWIKR
jgi:predicted nucleotidyltransferase